MSMGINPDRRFLSTSAMTIAARHFGVFGTAEAATPSR